MFSYQKLIKYIKIYILLNAVFISLSFISINIYFNDFSTGPELRTHKISAKVINSKTTQKILELGTKSTFFSHSNSYKVSLIKIVQIIKSSYNNIFKFKYNQYSKSNYNFSHLLQNKKRGPPNPA